uniref:Secreted protein n=1 Tax=Angiostrongylus cantonensis TaxID=6313 RepID=A0A0K0DG32_ANGCA
MTILFSAFFGMPDFLPDGLRLPTIDVVTRNFAVHRDQMKGDPSIFITPFKIIPVHRQSTIVDLVGMP